jgi:hypothetical protein
MALGIAAMIAAIPVDAAVIAWDESEETGVSVGPFRRVALAPFVIPELRDTRAGLGVTGVF